jgi:hypothetical protein
MPRRRFFRDSADWRSRAACFHDGDPEAFFPFGDDHKDEPSPRTQALLDEAKAFCQTSGPGGTACPVIAACLEDVLSSEGSNTFGVRGGTDPAERRRILRRRRDSARALQVAS